jgi:hypothetical protein
MDGNTGLGWRIPLTDEQFGGYKAGSDYKLALYMASSDTQGSFTDLKVKMGYQVADDSIETIEKNVSKLLIIICLNFLILMNIITALQMNCI